MTYRSSFMKYIIIFMILITSLIAFKIFMSIIYRAGSDVKSTYICSYNGKKSYKVRIDDKFSSGILGIGTWSTFNIYIQFPDNEMEVFSSRHGLVKNLKIECDSNVVHVFFTKIMAPLSYKRKAKYIYLDYNSEDCLKNIGCSAKELNKLRKISNLNYDKNVIDEKSYLYRMHLIDEETAEATAFAEWINSINNTSYGN